LSGVTVIPHLTFKGECEAAFRVYEHCLGGKITFLLQYGDTMPPPAPELEGKVVHATLKLGEQTLTGVDVPRADYKKPQGFFVQLNIEDTGEANRIFNTLAEAGVVIMAMQKTFWAQAFGIVTDKFGTPWEINCGES
jgi:PhnB protein